MADNSDKIKLLNKLLEEGQITEDMFNTNVAKLSSLKQNLRPEQTQRASDLSGVLDRVRENRGMVKNVSSDVKSALPGMAGISGKSAAVDTMGKMEVPKQTGTSLSRLNAPSRMGKTLKALGILGPAIGAMSISDKAMAGDFGGAGMEAADLATDYLPGIGQVKDAIRPEDMGNSELPADEMQARAIFNEEARKGKMGEPTRHPSFTETDISTEEPVREEDMEQFRSKFNTLKNMKY